MATPSDARFDPQDLLAHAGWLRRLALDLVPDAARAEDLVQETFLTALTSPPRSPRALRTWLGKVVRNLARQRHRSEAHRHAREVHAAAPEVLPSTEELAQEIDAQRTISREVMQLDEPYRTVLLLRYYRDLAPAEIARRQGVPAGTVRSQLTRGVVLLRERLEREEGGSQRLLCLAAGWKVSAPGAREASLLTLGTTGIIAMNAAVKIGLAAGLVGLAYVGWVRLEGLEPEDSSAVEADRVAAVAPTREQAPDLGVPELENEPAEAEREEAAPVPAAAPAPEPLEVSEDEEGYEPAALSVIFVDTDGIPQAGIRFSVREGRWGDAQGTAVRSDSSGRAELEVGVDSEVREEFIAQWAGGPFASGVSQIHLGPGESRALGTVVLEAGAAVLGRALDPDGRPVEGVRLWVDDIELTGGHDADGDLDERLTGILRRRGRTDLHSSPSWPAFAISGADGSFTLEGLPAGIPRRLWAWRDDCRYTWSDVFVLQPGEQRSGFDVEVELLADEDHIAGIIVGPDGEPVPNASLRYQIQAQDLGLSSGSPVGPDGRFDIVVWRSVPHQLTASADDGSLAAASLPDVQPGTLDLVLRLGDPEEGVLLRVHDELGEPIVNYRVLVRQITESGTFATSRGGRDHADGEMWLDAPAATFELEIEAAGYAKGEAGPFDGGVVPGGEIDLTLQPLPAVTGIVRGGGKALEGATVALHRILDDTEILSINGFPSRVQSSSVRATSAEDGSFEIFPFESGEYVLRASHPDWGVGELDRLWITVGEPSDEHCIVMPETGTLVVRVRRSDGQDPAGTIVGLNRYDGYARTFVADEKGEVRIEGLTPGGWAVTRADEEVVPNFTSSSSWNRPAGELPEWDYDCSVIPGETVVHELLVTPLEEPEAADDSSSNTRTGGG